MSLIARVVTDVTGVDKFFDYAVPDRLRSDVSIGCKVRVDLNSRRVGGWVIDVLDAAQSHVDVDRLTDIVAVSGHGVESELVPLCLWTAQRWCGPLRAVLSSASAPRVTDLRGRPQRGNKFMPSDDEVSSASRSMLRSGGGLIVVPPLQPALNVVAVAAHEGPVLALCPTKRMTYLGAARLRQRGYVVAVMPDDWSRAAGGVDVVMGTRSAVWAPCPDIASIVVIDSHDDSYTEERAPTWNAVAVARERSRRSGIPCIETSPAPTLASMRLSPQVNATSSSDSDHSADWPQIIVEDLLELPVKGSLVSSSLVEDLRDKKRTVLAILNVKGRASLLACKSCGHLALCDTCSSSLSMNEDATLCCVVCKSTAAKLCNKCGRTEFRMVRRGVSQLRDELSAAAQRDVVEVGTSTNLETLDSAICYVGTEAALHRVNSADTVCLLDFDDELMSPRLSALNDAMALLVRAARTVGRAGHVIVQTREPNHPLIRVLRRDSAESVSDGIVRLLRDELRRRTDMGLPPSTEYALLRGLRFVPSSELGVSVAPLGDGECALKAVSPEALMSFVSQLRMGAQSKFSVYVNPSRV